MSSSGTSPGMRRRTFTTLALAPLGALALPGIASADDSPEPAPAPPADCTLDPAVPKREFRAMWIASVTNIDWPSRPGLDEQTLKDQYRAWLDLAERLNHNAVVVQVRPNADAFWPSPYEPWSEWLTGARDGVGPGWDPLKFLVDEAHSRNLEFHAWFNPYRASMPLVSHGAGPDVNKLAPNHPLRQPGHENWAVVFPAASNAGSRLYYNPGVPEVREFVQTAIMDAVLNYDLDAVHFDDYFYPYPVAGFAFEDEATYQTYGVPAGWTNKADWRRNNIDLLVHEMSQKIHDAKPWVKFGISPFGIWRNKAADPLGSDTNGTQSYDANFANTRTWVKEGWLDYITPQIYWNIGFAVADYGKLAPWWANVCAGTDVHLYTGQADYKIAAAGQPAAWFDPNEMGKHIALNRSLGIPGSIHFSAKDVKANRLGATDLVRAQYYSKPAIIPTMARIPAEPMMRPVITNLSREADGIRVTWHVPGADGGAPFADAVSFAVYRVDGWFPEADECELADAAQLLGTVRGTSFLDTTVAGKEKYTYYVTALDRTWHESAPSTGRISATAH
jgi:uncharacterized lipoprotein YddW (UPF0748 family)